MPNAQERYGMGVVYRMNMRTRTTLALSGLLLTFVVFMGVWAQTAESAPSRPQAYTGDVSQLTASSAVLKASVNATGQPTSYYFQYGQTMRYEAQTSPTAAGESVQTIDVTAAVVGLAANTLYHYRIVAVNATGTTAGQDRSFTTKKIPLKFTISPTSGRTLFGSMFSVSGNLSGTGNTGRALVLQANPFPFLAGFKDIGTPELTDATGSFSFPVAGLSQNTQLRVATLDKPPATSATVVELVAVAVTLHLRATGRHGFVRLYGTVTPAQVGAPVAVQLIRAGRRPLSVAGTTIRTGTASVSRFSRVVHIRRAGLYRAFVKVLSGAQVSNQSRAVRIR